jgi:hypothetical protein
MNIVWKRPDGGVSVTHLTAEAESPRAEAAKLKERGDVPADWECVCYEVALPNDREFRNAWTWTTPEPVIDICPVKAREVTKERLRQERAPKLAELDVKFMRAVEQGDTAEQARIGAAKQALRDVTKLADKTADGDLDALKALKA